MLNNPSEIEKLFATERIETVELSNGFKMSFRAPTNQDIAYAIRYDKSSAEGKPEIKYLYKYISSLTGLDPSVFEKMDFSIFQEIEAQAIAMVTADHNKKKAILGIIKQQQTQNLLSVEATPLKESTS